MICNGLEDWQLVLIGGALAIVIFALGYVTGVKDAQ
jgi:hypothetical protein